MTVESEAQATKPIHSVPYQAGPKARYVEKSEIDNMRSTNII